MLPNKSEFKILVVGVVRNCEKKVAADVTRLQAAIGEVHELHWFLVESDSHDRTLTRLEQLSRTVNNFSYASLGELAKEKPLRTDRIAYCRNRYIDELKTNEKFNEIDYVIVADFDGLNTHISKEAIASCWNRDGWDMCAANQQGPYYDIWALRHKDWCPNDCWAQFRFLSRFGSDKEKNLYASVYSKMITIPVEMPWLEVDSAFGGLAIYKRELFASSKYCGLTDSGEEVCEHVFFHKKLVDQGAKLYINPALLNAHITEHAQHLYLWRSSLRKMKGMLLRVKNLSKR